MATLVELPDSVLLEIFSYLPVRDRIRISRVCHRWKRLVDDRWLWRHVDLTLYTTRPCSTKKTAAKQNKDGENNLLAGRELPQLFSALHIILIPKPLGFGTITFNVVRNRKRKCEMVRRHKHSALSCRFLAGFSVQPALMLNLGRAGQEGLAGGGVRVGECRTGLPLGLRRAGLTWLLRGSGASSQPGPGGGGSPRRLLGAPLPAACAPVWSWPGVHGGGVFFSPTAAPPLFKIGQSTFLSFLQREKHLRCSGKGPQRPLVTDRAIAVRYGHFFPGYFLSSSEEHRGGKAGG
ncbi:hypothetical protein H8959_010322 [Pygathrix nigripes]